MFILLQTDRQIDRGRTAEPTTAVRTENGADNADEEVSLTREEKRCAALKQYVPKDNTFASFPEIN